MKYSKTLFVATLATLISACSNTPPKVNGRETQINDLQQEAIQAQSKQIAALKYQVEQLVEGNFPSPMVSITPRLYQVYYPFNVSKLTVTPELRYSILKDAKQAVRINLLGRTDAVRPTDSDKKVAMARAMFLRDYFVHNGIDPTIIYVNYASATDYADNNWSRVGRKNNRRVEIEIYPQEEE
ncbi:OmpA family protein [Aliivibrio fischeri]|uniref:OmpA family protein n=1 Tax=Aliivibrio fischeri TaxID=668 RepID=UPI0012D8E63A|nr:OmpA family protein [Aliivibrio fischeri]MUK76558.1 OmpA family protein [Aliivibrio fischeri]